MGLFLAAPISSYARCYFSIWFIAFFYINYEHALQVIEEFVYDFMILIEIV